jgi:hypothetical protein
MTAIVNGIPSFAEPAEYQGWVDLFTEQNQTGSVHRMVLDALAAWARVMDHKPPVVEAARKIAAALGEDPDARLHYGIPGWSKHTARAKDELIAIALGYSRQIECNTSGVKSHAAPATS